MNVNNMTVNEARQRISLNNMAATRVDGEWRITYPEYRNNPVRQEATAYYTDDNEDAALTAAAMRRSMDATRRVKLNKLATRMADFLCAD